MARTIRLIILSALILALAPLCAFAQVQTGSILVKAVDQQGAVVPGATVTITSPVLPAPLSGVTDSAGVYRFPSLTVGTYVVRVALQGFKTSVREGLQVLQGQTVSVDAQLSVGGMTEETTVKGEPPVVDTKSANVKVNIDKDLLENTPGGKDIWSILQSKAPGIVFDAPDVGGNQAGLQRAFTARGTPNAQNTQMLNGVNVNDPSAQGFSMNYYDPSSFENIQVSSGAQDIAVGTAGVFINMVTKSGTNKFNGQGLFTCQGNCGVKTQSSNVNDALVNAGFRTDSNAVDYIRNYNAQMGGPLVKNKLFFFGSYNYQQTHVNVPGFPAVSPLLPITLSTTPGKDIQDTTDIMTGTGKFNYQMNSRNRFEAFVERQKYDKPNRGASASNTPDSNSKELDYGNTFQGGWNLLISDRMFADSKISYNNIHFPLFQKTSLQSILDNTSGIRYRNSATDQRFFRERLQATSNLQYFVPSMLGGRHEFKGGVDFGHTPATTDNFRADDVNLVYLSSTGKGTTVTLFNSPIHFVSAVNSLAFYAQDSYSIGRLTVIAGTRWERVEGYLPAQNTPASRYFPEGQVFKGVSIGGVVQDYTVKKSFSEVRNNPLWYNWAPRASMTYDLTGDGKTVLKASLGRYLDQINTGTPPNPNGTISQTYNWIDNGDLVFQPGTLTWDGTKYVGGELGTLTATNIPNPAAFDTTLRRPKRNEFTIGVDREVIPTVLLGATYIYRKEKDNQTTVDQNITQWDTLYTKATLTDPGRDGVLGTSDDAPIVVYNQNQTGTITVNKVVNDDRVAQRYNGVELTLNRRFKDGWTVLAGYTYSHTKQDFVSLANPNAAYVNGSGESPIGRTHNFKLAGTYTLPFQIVLGANATLQSGLPNTRTWAINACSGTITTNCLRQSVTVNAEPRGNDILPRLLIADARIGKFFKVGTNKIDVSLDVYNLTNAVTTYSVRSGTGLTAIRVGGLASNPPVNIPTYRSPTGVLGPRILRLNVTYSFSQK